MNLRCHCFWRFSWPAALLGEHNRIHSCFVCFNQSSYGPIVQSHITPAFKLKINTLKSVYCPVNRAQARAAFMGFVWDEERKTKYLLANRILMSSLFDQGLFDMGDWVWVRCQ